MFVKANRVSKAARDKSADRSCEDPVCMSCRTGIPRSQRSTVREHLPECVHRSNVVDPGARETDRTRLFEKPIAGHGPEARDRLFFAESHRTEGTQSLIRGSGHLA